MSVRYIDSCDAVSGVEIITRYNLAQNWNSALTATVPNGGRFGAGTQAYRLNEAGVTHMRLGHSGTLVSKMITGIWIAHGATIGLSNAILMFRHSGVSQVAVVYTSQSHLELYCGGVLRGSSTSIIASGTFNGIELEAHWHPTAGSATVYVSDAFFMSFTGNTTTAGASGFDEGLYGRATGAAVDFDDWYLFDDQGETNTTRIGSNCRIRLHRVNGSAVSAWIPVGDTGNDLCVDETLPDDLTTYVHTSAAGTIDRYNVTAATGVYSSVETPRAAQIVARGIAPSGGSPTLRLLCELSGTTVSGATTAASTAWSHNFVFPVSVRPGGSTWAISHVDNTTIGMENIAAAPIRVTWVALEILTASGASLVSPTTLTTSLVWIQSSVSGVRNVIIAPGTTVSAEWVVSGGTSPFTQAFTFGGVSNIAGFGSTATTSIITRTFSVAGVREVSATVSDASAHSATSAVRIHTAAVVVPNYHDGKITISSQSRTRTMPL